MTSEDRKEVELMLRDFKLNLDREKSEQRYERTKEWTDRMMVALPAASLGFVLGLLFHH
jgi:hypothetical protein